MSELIQPKNDFIASSSSKYILVAEDDHLLATIYKIKLSKENFEVYIAPNGEAALQQIKERKPDFLLLDLMMPVKNGFEVLEELKKNEGTKDIKVIVLSNAGQEEEIQKAKSFGILDYIVKSDSSLSNIIEKLKYYIEQAENIKIGSKQ